MTVVGVAVSAGCEVAGCRNQGFDNLESRLKQSRVRIITFVYLEKIVSGNGWDQGLGWKRKPVVDEMMESI